MNKWTLILPHSYHLTCLKLRPLRRAGLDLLVVGTNCGQWRPFWGKGTDQWTNLTLLRKKNLKDILYLCVRACIRAVPRAHVWHTHTHTHPAACLYVRISLPVSASPPWWAESSEGLFLHPLWPVNDCSHSIAPELVKLSSYQCKSFFLNIRSLYTRCAVPCLSNDRAQEVSRDQAMVLLFLYCDQDWYSVTIG